MALPVNKRVLKILFILFVVAFCIYLIPTTPSCQLFPATKLTK